MNTPGFRSVAQTMSRAVFALLLALPVTNAAADDAQPRPAVRLAVVNAPHHSGLLAYLLPAFEQTSGYRVEVYSGNDAYERAGQGQADIVIAHYGKAPTAPFVASGAGTWPRPVFSNQSVLVGPKDDPAKIRGMKDPFEAMKKIVASGSTFVAPSYPVGRYLSELLLAGAGNPERGAWYIESPQAKGRAMLFAEEKAAYTIWGSFPFERFTRRRDSTLEVMVWETPIFHRLMAVTVAENQVWQLRRGDEVVGFLTLEAIDMFWTDCRFEPSAGWPAVEPFIEASRAAWQRKDRDAALAADETIQALGMSLVPEGGGGGEVITDFLLRIDGRVARFRH